MKRPIIALASLSIVIIGLLSIAHPKSASAQQAKPSGPEVSATTSQVQSATFDWVNVEEISATINGKTIDFVDVLGMDHYWNSDPAAGGTNADNNPSRYVNTDTCSGNTSTIWADPYYTTKGEPYFHASISVGEPNKTGSSCQTVTINAGSLKIGQKSKSNIFYQFDGDDIDRVDNDSGYVFVPSGYPGVYVKQDQTSSNCPDTIYYDTSTSGGNATLWTMSSGATGYPAPPSAIHAGSGCGVNNDTSDLNDDETILGGVPVLGTHTGKGVNVATNSSTGSETLNIGGTAPSDPGVSGSSTPSGGGGGNGGGSGTSTPDVCEAGGINISWLLCPIINGVAHAESAIEDVIGGLLKTPLVTYNNSNCNENSGNSDQDDCIFSAWSNIRVFGNVLLVIGLLVAVLVEAFGGGVAEAYTVKRMLPRILIAAILINLSIYFIGALEDITNIFGKGVFDLLKDAFYVGTPWNLRPNGFSTNLVGAGIAAGGIAAFSPEFLAFFGLFVLLPALFAVISVLFTLILRQGILIMLLVLSPIAFALYCLPNTEQYFKKWWSLLFKTLMVYPIMMAIFAIGDISYVIMNYVSSSVASADSLGWIAGLLPILALVAPLFLVPFAFKLSGGIIGQIHAGISGISHKANEAIKGNPNDPNSLRNRTRRNLQIRNTARGITPGQIGTRINPHRLTPEGNRRARSRINLQQEVGTNLLRQQIEQSPLWHEAAKDSNIMKELAENTSGREARQRLNADMAAGRLTRVEYDRRSAAIAGAERIGFNGATRRAALMNSNYIGFEVAPGSQGWNDTMGRVRELSGGNEFAFRSMQDEFQSVAKGAGQRTDVSANTDGRTEYNLDRATGNQNLYTLLNSKPRAVGSLIDEHMDRLHNTAGYITKNGGTATAANIAEARRKSALFLTEMKNASNKNQGSAAARDEINARMTNIDTAYDSYVSDEVSSRMAAGVAPPTARNEAVEVTTPIPGGGSETRRTVQSRTLSAMPEQLNEAHRQLRAELDEEARAYTPPDINNIT